MNFKTNFPKELESTHNIRFQDCDPFGHLNNARYVNYFMNAREDQIARYYGFNIFGVALEQNKNWVVTRNQLAYHAPAGVMEEVRIITRLIQASETTLVVEGVMIDAAGKRVKAVSWMAFTFVSLETGRPARHPQEMMALFNAVLIDKTETAAGFEQRVQDLRSFYRHQCKQQNDVNATESEPTLAQIPF